MNFSIDSYLMMYTKRNNFDIKKIEDFINSYVDLVYFENIGYINGEVSKEHSDLYDDYIKDLYNHTVKLERYIPRADNFRFTIPLTKNLYNLNGSFYTNVIALFGRNYYTDDETIDTNLRFIGCLVFEDDYIPLYNTSDYGVQINAALDFKTMTIDGDIQNLENRFTTINTYYNEENVVGINIMNNIILE